MWWGSGGGDGGAEEEDDLPDLKEQFQAQENLLGQLKGALKSNEAKLQNKEKQVKALASRLSKSKLEERAKEAAAKQTERQLLAETTGALPKVTPQPEANVPASQPATKKGSKLSRLRQELQDARQKEAEMLEGQQSLEDKVSALQRELAERDSLIRDYDLASVGGGSLLGSPGSSSPYVMSPEGSPPMGSSFEDVFNASSKSGLIVDLNEKIIEAERRILDLEEDLRNKDEVIRARTEAVTAVSKDMSSKGRSVLEELEETRGEMRDMQLRFAESEMAMKKDNMRLGVDVEALSSKLGAALESEARSEEVRFELSTKNAAQQEKIVRLQSDLNTKRTADSARELELVELRAQLESSKAALASKSKDTQERLDAFYDKISFLLEDENEDETLASTLKDLQSQLIDLEEEKGNLQLRLIDYEDERGTNLKAELQKLKESLRNKDEECFDLQTAVEESKNEIQEISEQLEKKEKDLSSFVEQVSRLQEGHEEVSRSKVAAEMRSLELEEMKESLEAEKKDLESKITEMTTELKEPFEKMKTELAQSQEALSSLERTHSECKARSLNSDRDLLDKAERIKEHQIEVASLEKVLQAKSTEISDELTRSDLIQKELESLKESYAEVRADLERKEEEILAFKSSNLQEQIDSMDDQIISLNLDVAEKQEAISSLESDFTELQSQLNEKEKEVSTLGDKYDALSEENVKLLNTKEELHSKLKDLEEENSGFESNKLKYDSEVNELNAKILDLDSEMSLKVSQLTEELNKSREEAEKEVGSLNETLSEKNKTIKSLKEEAESIKMELEALNEKNFLLSTEVERQTYEIGGLSSQLSEQESEKGLNEDYEGQISGLNLKLKECEDQRRASSEELKTLKERKNELEESVQGLTSELESLRSTLNESHMERDRLREELSAYSGVTQNDELISHLESSILDLQGYKDSIKTELGDKVSEIQGLKDIILELQTMMSDLKAEIGSKSSRIQSLEEELSQINNNNDDEAKISDLEAAQRELTARIKVFEEELASKEGEAQELSSQKNTLEKELLSLRQTADSSELSSSLEEKIKENSTLQDKVDSLNVKLHSLEENYNRLLEGREGGNLIAERDKLKLKNDQLLDKARKLLIKCKQQDKSIKEKDEELKRSKEELRDLTEKWETEKSEKEELRSEVTALHVSTSDLQKNYDEALRRVSELTAEVDSLSVPRGPSEQEELHEVHKQVDELELQNTQLKKTIEDLNKRLGKNEGQVEEADGWDDGFTFDDDPIEEKKVDAAQSSSAPLAAKPEEDGWGDEGWSAWGAENVEIVESSKLEKDSRETEKSSSLPVKIKEFELQVMNLQQELSKEKEKLEVERSKFSEEEEAFYERIDSLEKEVSARDARLESLRSSLDQAQSECKKLEQRSNEVSSATCSENKKLMIENKEKSEHVQSLEDELSCLSSVKSEMQALNDILSSSLAEKEALVLSISTLETRIQDMERAKAESAELQRLALSESEASMTQQVQYLSEANATLTAEAETSIRSLVELSTSEGRLRSELELLKDSYESLCSANNANESEHVTQLTVELERLRSEAINGQVQRGELESQVQDLLTQRQGLEEQVQNHRATEESLNSNLRHFQEREAQLEGVVCQLNTQVSMLSQDVESHQSKISCYETQLESLRRENEGLNARCSSLTLELESKCLEMQQLQRAVSLQEEAAAEQLSAPPPDVTVYQQQPDVALHSIPQPDIMPSGYVDLVQEQPHQAEVQTHLSSTDIEQLSVTLTELQREVSALQEFNAGLQRGLAEEQQHHQETSRELSIKVSELRGSEKNNNAEAGSDSTTDTTAEVQSTVHHSPPDMNSVEWYQGELDTYLKAIYDWQEWGRIKSEELEGYANAYNEAVEVRSALEAQAQGYTLNIQGLSSDVQQLQEARASVEDSWRAKVRSKEIEIQDLTETAERLKSEKEELNEELSDLRAKNESLRGDGGSSSEELEELKYQLEELAEEKRLQSLEMESIKRERSEWLSKEENLQKMNGKLKSDADLAHSVIKKLESEIKEGEDEFKKKESLAGENLLASQNAAEELDKEVQALKAEISSHKEEISTLQELLDKERTEKSHFSNEKNEEIDSITSEISSLKEELSSVKGSLDTANAALADWSSWGQTKMTEYETLFKSYEEYVNGYNAINAELSALKEGLRTSEESADKIRTNMEVLKSSAEESNHSSLLEDLKVQLAASLQESEKLKEEVQNVRLRNGKLTVRSKQMEKELAAIKKGGEPAELTKNVSSLQDELLESAKNMEDMNNERLSLSEKVSHMENQIDILNADNEVLRNVRADYDSLKIKYDVLISEKSPAPGDEDNLLVTQFETEIQRKNAMLTQLEGELSQLRLLGDTERLELDKSLRENRQLNSQMNYWKQQIYTDQSESGGSPQNELIVARHAASAFQVQVEQLTTELTKLQEERDTLQLKLSNLMRQYERQRESSSRASTACSTPIPWVDSSLVEIKELKSKIEELGNLNYALDVELQKERQTREAMQARLRHQSSSSSSSTPVHLPQKSTPSDLSLSGGHVLHL